MNGREALRALADGKRVRRACWRTHEFICVAGDRVVDEDGAPYRLQALHCDDWEIIESPATDEELIAEIERIGNDSFNDEHAVHHAYLHCARMLRERKVKP